MFLRLKDVSVRVFMNWSPYQFEKNVFLVDFVQSFDHYVVGTPKGHFPMLLMSKQGQFYQAKPRCFRRRLCFIAYWLPFKT